ncbi:uncharacterized protein LOC110976338 [Acanthaster planci]|uniref:Uncharacterized protein LOC110976338 n=1 Tax=Acanthaster planci TaxID=133434 RepID=A0A8B7XWG6_ACAPL|nr:uncharacterized protein LOC110976338 [Acanthaster planci]
MATVQCCCAVFALLLKLTVGVAQAAPNLADAGNNLQELLPSRESTSASLALAPPSTEEGVVDDATVFGQVATGFIQEGRSMVHALQDRLTLLEQFVPTGFNQMQPDLAGGLSPKNMEKRENLSPTQRVMVRREIMRRIRERAPEPVELPIGIRFFQNPVPRDGATVEKRGGAPQLSASGRAAILAAIMRQIGQQRQPVELPGMRGGK